MSADYQIEAFVIEDYDEVITFWRGQEGIGLNDADERTPIARLLQRNPGMSFVVRSGSTIVATILATHDSRRGYLHHLAVAPAYRKLGLGKQLVELALQQLKDAGINKCNIFVYNDNTDAAKFWQKLGFAVRTDLMIMQKTEY